MSWMIYISAYLEMLIHKFRSVMSKYDFHSILAPISWCFDTYPILSVVTLLIVFTYAVPICIFVLFAVITFLVTFTGFLFIEGTIVAVAFFLLLSILSTLTIIFSIFFLTCWTIYVIMAQLCLTFSINSFSEMTENEPSFRNNNHMNHSFHGNEE